MSFRSPLRRAAAVAAAALVLFVSLAAVGAHAAPPEAKKANYDLASRWTPAKVGKLVAMATPAADGTPLLGDLVDVNDRLFWFALSQLAWDRASNLRLLSESPFFALSVTYASGQTANIAFEKGHSGAAVFQQVLAAWGP